LIFSRLQGAFGIVLADKPGGPGKGVRGSLGVSGHGGDGGPKGG